MNINPNVQESASQSQRILAALQNGDTITPLDALRRFGSFRLGARIHELMAKGYPIVKEWVKTPNGKRVMSYRMNINE